MASFPLAQDYVDNVVSVNWGGGEPVACCFYTQINASLDEFFTNEGGESGTDFQWMLFSQSGALLGSGAPFGNNYMGPLNPLSGGIAAGSNKTYAFWCSGLDITQETGDPHITAFASSGVYAFDDKGTGLWKYTSPRQGGSRVSSPIGMTSTGAVVVADMGGSDISDGFGASLIHPHNDVIIGGALASSANLDWLDTGTSYLEISPSFSSDDKFVSVVRDPATFSGVLSRLDSSFNILWQNGLITPDTTSWQGPAAFNRDETAFWFVVDGSLFLIDTASGAVLKSVSSPSPGNELALDRLPSGDLMVCDFNSVVYICDMETGLTKRSFSAAVPVGSGFGPMDASGIGAGVTVSQNIEFDKFLGGNTFQNTSALYSFSLDGTLQWSQVIPCSQIFIPKRRPKMPVRS